MRTTIDTFESMTLPDLYREGLTQRSLGGEAHLNAYKLGLIEAILKEGLRAEDAEGEVLRAKAREALDVALWEPRPPRGL